MPEVRKKTTRSRAKGSVGSTRDKILDTAAEFFAREGYKATNLDAIAERLGITRQALYYYFPSKQDILSALIDDVRKRLEARIGSVSTTGDDRFSEMLRAHIAFIVENVTQMAILQRERAEIAQFSDSDAAEWSRLYVERFAQAYDLGVAAGRFRRTSSRMAASLLINSANSITDWYGHGAVKELNGKAFVDTTLDLLLNGVNVDRPGD